MDSDQNQPQADGANPPPAGFAPDQGQDYAGEHDFAGFQPDVRESLLPRWLHLALIGLLGLGAAAALVMAGMFVTQQRKTDKTLELLAASSRGELSAPAVPGAATVGEKKARDLLLLPAPATGQAPAEARPGSAPQGTVPAAVNPGQVAASADAVPATRATQARPKQVVKKKKPKPKQGTALAQRGESQSWQRERGESRTWPRRRGDSITEKLNAAVAACRARPHAPGECNLRACDILGNNDPACR